MDYTFNTNMSAPRSYAEALAAQDELERQRQQELAKQLAAETVAAQAPQTQQTATSAPNNGLAATAAPYAPMDSAARMIARQVYDTKGLYDEAAKAGDTDTMNRASAFANQLREAGQKYGIDTSRFGADVTRDQLGALLQNDYAKAITDVGNMLTPQEHYQQAFQNYKSQGVSDRRARDLALNDAERYEGEYARKMAVAMDAYGLNADGSMNQHSGLIQTLAYLNNPMGAAIYDRYYANPKEQWKYDKELEAAGFMNGLRQANSLQNYEQTRALNQDKYAFQGGENEANRQHQMTMLALKAQIDAKTEADRRAWIESNPELAGVLYGRKGSGGSGNGTETEVVQQLENAISQAAQAVDNGKSRAEDGEAVENARALMENLYSKGKIDKDTYTVAYDRINQLISNRDKKWKRYNYANNIPEK